MSTDERNFRSTYYEKVGCRSVEEKRSLEILLKEKPLNRTKLRQFCLRFTVPSVHRALLWNLLLGETFGTHNQNASSVSLLVVLCSIRFSTRILWFAWLCYGPNVNGLRRPVPSFKSSTLDRRQNVQIKNFLCNVAVRKTKTEAWNQYQCLFIHPIVSFEWLTQWSICILQLDHTFVDVTEVLNGSSISENDVDLYWIAKGFYEITLEISRDFAKLKDLTFTLLEKEDNAIFK